MSLPHSETNQFDRRRISAPFRGSGYGLEEQHRALLRLTYDAFHQGGKENENVAAGTIKEFAVIARTKASAFTRQHIDLSYMRSPQLKRGPMLLGRSKGVGCERLFDVCFDAAGHEGEDRARVYLDYLRDRVEATRSWGRRMRINCVDPAAYHTASALSAAPPHGRNRCLRRKSYPSHIEPALFRTNDDIKRIGRDSGVYRDEVDDADILRESLEVPSDPREKSVRSLVRFFEGRASIAQHVRMLELENRELCQLQRKLECENSQLLRNLDVATTRIRTDQSDLDYANKVLQQKQDAVEGEMRSYADEIASLRKRLQVSMTKFDESKEELHKSEETIALLKQELQLRTQQVEDETAQKSKLKDRVDNFMREARARVEQWKKDEEFLRDNQIRLERFAHACECLGEEKLIILEFLKRARAKQELAASESRLFQKYLDDMTKERDHFHDVAVKTKEAALEREAFMKSKFESESKSHQLALKKKDNEIFLASEKQLNLEKAVRRMERSWKEHAEIMEQHSKLLQNKSEAMRSFVARLRSGVDEAEGLKAFVSNVRAFYAENADLFRSARGVRAAGQQDDSTASGTSTKKGTHPHHKISDSRITQGFNAAADHEGIMSADVAAATSRRLGLAPSVEEINNLRAKSSNKVTLPIFVEFCSTASHNDDIAEDMASFFSLWDERSSGFLTRKQMRNLLRSFGEPLSEQEADFALQSFAGEGDEVDYREFCKRLVENQES